MKSSVLRECMWVLVDISGCSWQGGRRCWYTVLQGADAECLCKVISSCSYGCRLRVIEVLSICLVPPAHTAYTALIVAPYPLPKHAGMILTWHQSFLIAAVGLAHGSSHDTRGIS